MLTIVNWHYYLEPTSCAFPHWKGCLKIENSRLARVNLILLLVWTIHTAIIEGKHLKVQKKSGCEIQCVARQKWRQQLWIVQLKGHLWKGGRWLVYSGFILPTLKRSVFIQCCLGHINGADNESSILLLKRYKMVICCRLKPGLNISVVEKL